MLLDPLTSTRLLTCFKDSRDFVVEMAESNSNASNSTDDITTPNQLLGLYTVCGFDGFIVTIIVEILD
jgi:hypothetical protein